MGRTYVIETLVKDSAERVAGLAMSLRNTESAVFPSYLHRVMQYQGWPQDDPTMQVARKEVQLVVDYVARGLLRKEWTCVSCNTVFRHMSLQGLDSDLVLQQCPNCAHRSSPEDNDTRVKQKPKEWTSRVAGNNGHEP